MAFVWLDGLAALDWLAVGLGAVSDGIGGDATGDDETPIEQRKKKMRQCHLTGM